MADLADAVRDGDQRGLFAPRGGDHGCFPRELEVQAVVRPGDEKEETKVAGPDVRGRYENSATDCTTDYRQNYVPE